MPLQDSTESRDEIAKALSLASLNPTPTFLVVYASRTDGRMWCGDCRDAEALVTEKFGKWKDEVKVVYAGQKAEWKTPDNIWRQAPLSVRKLPTIIKVLGKNWERLEETDVSDKSKLDAFVDHDI